MTNNMGELIVLFKTFEELQRDECAIYKEHYDAWHAAYRHWDLIMAALANDENELTKLAAGGAELELAKSEAARLKKRHGELAEFYTSAALAKQLRELVEKRNERLYGHSALSKRSVRFASAHARRNYGPGANSLPPAN
jgi:hypothetical protein